jgi:predicted ATPase
MTCMSTALRQLMVYQSDLHRFVATLRSQLGPQLQNVPLLYNGAPELRDILALFNINMDSPHENLSTAELRARFQSLVVDVFSVLAQTRLLAILLDDLHEADVCGSIIMPLLSLT